ncbi:CpaE family protein [Roseomonas sp. GCM10028921]
MLVERRPPRDTEKESSYVAAEGAPRLPLVAFVTDEESEAALRGGLVDLGVGLTVRKGDARTAARALEREPTPYALLVDISGLADPLGALDALAGVCAPDVRVLVIGESSNLALYRRMTREVGIAEYLYKPLTREDVSRIFGPHVTGGSSEGGGERGGALVTVSGARGGCGATTIAVNLALHLAEVSRGHVALLDLHLRGGSTGMMLGLKSGTGLRVALEDPSRVDGLFLDRSSVSVSERVRLIAAEEPMETDLRPNEGGVKNLLAMLTARFNFVVVDTPCPPDMAERIAHAAALHRLIVTGPDIAGIRDTIALRKLLSGLGTGSVGTVLNRVGLPGGLKAKLLEEGLGSPFDLVLPDLPKHLPRAAHLGKPAISESGAFRRALAPLTQRIAAPKAVTASSSLLGRLLGRRTF